MRQADVVAIGDWIAGQEKVSRKELEDYLLSKGMKRSYLSIAIKRLCDNEICFEQKDGVYFSMGGRKRYKSSELEPTLENHLLSFKIPVVLCPVSGYELNRFLPLQSFKPRLIIYAPKIVHDELAAFLSSKGYSPLILRKRDFSYINEKTVFLSGLHWRTPVDRKGKRLYIGKDEPLICGPTLEKILIDSLAGDFLCDDAMIEELFRTALSNYAYNASIMKRYAKDRSKEDRLRRVIFKCGLDEVFYD